jgi:hypothetical protein
MFLFFSYSLLHPHTALRTKGMALSQPGAAFGTGKLEAGLQMFDGYCALAKIYVINC